jgi:hypothetical protein
MIANPFRHWECMAANMRATVERCVAGAEDIRIDFGNDVFKEFARLEKITVPAGTHCEEFREGIVVQGRHFRTITR